jgi:hypothetical protein
MLDRTRYAVEGPDHHDLEPATPGIGHQPIESWPLLLGSADGIAVLANDLVAALSSHLPQVEQLGFWVLVGG